MTIVRVWLGHDGYRDPDDNLGLLVGAAQARTAAINSPDVQIAGVVFGDTTDGGQFHMLKPRAATPARLDDGDPRYDQISGNLSAAGNYAFFKNYGEAAVKELAPGWDIFDLLADDKNGNRVWNYDATGRGGMAAASWELAQDIRYAISRGGVDAPEEVVVYSAGGGAHVAAEAIGYLLNKGYDEATLKRYFAVVQHGESNWWVNQEAEAREATRAYTIPLAVQDPDSYSDGSIGPGLKKLVRDGVWLDGGRFGEAFQKATAVAQGLEPFENLGSNRTFRTTTDGSDAGSDAFAVDHDALLAEWGNRLAAGEDLPTYQEDLGHFVRTPDGFRSRVMYNAFDWQDARDLMNGTWLPESQTDLI